MSLLIRKNDLKEYISPVITDAKVISNKYIGCEMYELHLECPYIADHSKPGQFVSVYCPDLLLRRPFSIAGTKGDNIRLLYKTKGKGTIYLAGLNPGNQVNILGAAGNGFGIHTENALLIGAGAGIAPILFLSRDFNKSNIQHTIVTGLKEKVNIPDFPLSNSITITEDGSTANKGLITDYLEDLINSIRPDKIYACGPEVVLKYIIDISIKLSIPVEVAIEKVFACGTGVCLGCKIDIIENNTIKTKRVCKDGPVFNGSSIVWQ